MIAHLTSRSYTILVCIFCVPIMSGLYVQFGFTMSIFMVFFYTSNGGPMIANFTATSDAMLVRVSVCVEMMLRRYVQSRNH